MKTHCKPAKVDVENTEFNAPAVFMAFDGKMRRKDFRRVLIGTGLVTAKELDEESVTHDLGKSIQAKDAVAEMLTQRIRDRDLKLRPIRQFEREDGLTHKIRTICQEHPEQQIFEYIAVNALEDLFRAKLLPFQYGSIPGRGQLAGKRKIERLIRRKFPKPVDAVKCDVRKAYPSVTIECVMRLLCRDIGKNKVLLWFLNALMANYPGGHLCIGGYLPSWLFNYVMSYVLRCLMSLKQSRRGVETKMVKTIVCYADDFVLIGNFSQIKRALKKATEWTRTTLGIGIKNAWQIYHLESFEAEKELHAERKEGACKRTPGIDMMGWVVRKTYTIIRRRVFRRIRRQFIRAEKDVRSYGYIPWWRACRLMAYKGWIAHSNSRDFARNYSAYKLLRKAKGSVSKRGRKEYIRHEQRILLSLAA